MCVIKVGAATEVELKEKKHRIEDAVSATRAAIEEGVVAGGGSALIHAAAALKDDLGLTGDERVGVNIVRKALVEPTRWIAENGGEQGYVVTSKVAELEPGNGFNAATGEYGDLFGAGRHRPGEGDAFGARQRGVHRLAAAHHRDLGGGEAGGRGAGGGRTRSHTLSCSTHEGASSAVGRPFGLPSAELSGDNICCPSHEGPLLSLPSDLSATGVPEPFATLGLTFDDVLLQPAQSEIVPPKLTRALGSPSASR